MFSRLHLKSYGLDIFIAVNNYTLVYVIILELYFVVKSHRILTCKKKLFVIGKSVTNCHCENHLSKSLLRRQIQIDRKVRRQNSIRFQPNSLSLFLIYQNNRSQRLLS